METYDDDDLRTAVNEAVKEQDFELQFFSLMIDFIAKIEQIGAKNVSTEANELKNAFIQDLLNQRKENENG